MKIGSSVYRIKKNGTFLKYYFRTERAVKALLTSMRRHFDTSSWVIVEFMEMAEVPANEYYPAVPRNAAK